jgi:hypothetical protein
MSLASPHPDRRAPLIFNSALETGVRSVINLVTNYPKAFDLDRMIALDHLIVHVADVGGPASAHPDTPKRATEMIVRRGVVERGLLLMESRKLVARLYSSSGISYEASESAAGFVSWLKSDYEKWALEFQPIETPSGS